jgi:asparagine synthase (glutamine-hydrolysing)
MCGIAGCMRWSARDDTTVVAHMIEALSHRGPDAGATVTDRGVTLGHRRLAIIDTSRSADQPMQDSESGAWIIFNGEIYNFRDLRRELESDGVIFRTNSDTEVLLRGVVRHGTAWVQRLIGMFAFAVWFPRERELMLVRDRIGKKPLYYQELKDGLAFASELTALRRHPEVSSQIDAATLGQYLALGYTTTNRCIFEGVKKLPPGHILTVRPGGRPKLSSYWDLAAKLRDKSAFRTEDEAAEALGATLDDAVRLRLIADVPVGTFLSGGVDSAAITESLCRQEPGADIGAYTMGFDVADHSEVDDAAETAALLGIGHHVFIADSEALQQIDRVAAFADEPFADTSMLPFYHLSAFARKRVKVALSGDGGDELFAGYPTYAADRLHELTRWIPSLATQTAAKLVDRFLPRQFGKVSFDYKLRRYLAGQGLPADRAHCFWRGLFDSEDLMRLAPGQEAIHAANPFDAFAPHFDMVADCHPLDRAMYVDIKTWLVDDILFKVDRMSMAHALEVRAPFLDHRLVEMAAGLPPEWKLRRFQGKRVLRRYLTRRLPAQILRRPKSGFNAPVSRWLEGSFGIAAREVTMSGAIADWFDVSAIDALWREHLEHRRDNGFRLFALLCLALWLSKAQNSAPADSRRAVAQTEILMPERL